MTRTTTLRAGYAGLGVAFVALAATFAVPSMILVGLLCAFVAGIILAFTDDHLPKWAGITVVVYFVLSIVAFLAMTPITIHRGGETFFTNTAPPGVADAIIDWMGRIAPLLLTGAAIAAVWERERAPKMLLTAALAGFLLHALLYVLLTPSGEDMVEAIASAQSQARVLSSLFAVSAIAGAAASFWASARADSI